MAQYTVFVLNKAGGVVEANNHFEAALNFNIQGYDIVEVALNDKSATIIVQGQRVPKAYKLVRHYTEQDIDKDKELNSLCISILRDMYIVLEKKYYPPKDIMGLDNCAPYQTTLWFEGLIEDILMHGVTIETIKSDINTLCIKQKRVEPKVLLKYIEKYISLDKIVHTVNIRKDFATALKSVRHGSDLSSDLGWGFSDRDICELAKLHKANKYRRKIEDLLTDCNFHSECADFIDGSYDKYIK